MLNSAISQSKASLSVFETGSEFHFRPVKFATQNSTSCIIRAISKSCHKVTYICKAFKNNDEATQEVANLNRIQTQNPYVSTTPRHLTPKVLHFSRENSVVIMEDVDGVLLDDYFVKANTIDDTLSYHGSAARWLSSFHAASAQTVAFEPAPILTKVKNRVRQYRKGQRRIVDPERFAQRYLQLEKLGKLALHQRSTVCTIHGDYRPANLILKSNEDLYAIDLKVTPDSSPLRDIFDYYFAFVTRQDFGWNNISHFNPALRMFIQEYDKLRMEKNVRAFMWLSYLLLRWANLSNNNILSQQKTRKLAITRALCTQSALSP